MREPLHPAEEGTEARCLCPQTVSSQPPAQVQPKFVQRKEASKTMKIHLSDWHSVAIPFECWSRVRALGMKENMADKVPAFMEHKF